MSDLIERQAAINALKKHEIELPIYTPRETDVFWDDAIDCCVSEIEGLPSAQPERKKGSWIEDGYNHYKAVCSECGEPCATYVMGKPRDNFCKWCGADMRGEQNGQ